MFGSNRLELIARARAFAWDRSFRKVRFESLVWKMLPESLRLDTKSLLTLSIGTFTWEFEMFSLGNFSFYRLGSLLWNLLLAFKTSCFERSVSFAWDPLLEIFCPRSSAWNLSLWIFLFGSWLGGNGRLQFGMGQSRFSHQTRISLASLCVIKLFRMMHGLASYVTEKGIGSRITEK